MNMNIILIFLISARRYLMARKLYRGIGEKTTKKFLLPIAQNSVKSKLASQTSLTAISLFSVGNWQWRWRKKIVRLISFPLGPNGIRQLGE
jgi:hypothetical protein